MEISANEHEILLNKTNKLKKVNERKDSTQSGSTSVFHTNSNSFDTSPENDKSLYLMGLGRMKNYLRFIRNHSVKPRDNSALISEWQKAKDYYRSLKKMEAGSADNAEIIPIKIDEKYEPLLIGLLSNPLLKHGYDDVPTEVAFVNLDQLVVYQKHIDLTYVENLKNRLGESPTDEQIFRTCLPFDHSHPPCKWSRIDESSYMFISKSNDIRFLGAMPLQAEHIQGYPHPGSLMGVIGLAVGFGSNFLNVIHANNRLILHNGSHRAYVLKALGFKRVPCLVQHAQNHDELALVAPSDVVHNSNYFLTHPRPSMLKDYFNPKLQKIVDVQKVVRQVKVQFSVSEQYAPAI